MQKRAKTGFAAEEIKKLTLNCINTKNPAESISFFRKNFYFLPVRKYCAPNGSHERSFSVLLKIFPLKGKKIMYAPRATLNPELVNIFLSLFL